MITFDSNGIATRESQVHIDKMKLAILNSGLSDAGQASALADLYNRYGLVYGTYQRFQATTNAADDQIDSYRFGARAEYKEGDPTGLRPILWCAVAIGLFAGTCYLDKYLANNHDIHINFVKTVMSIARG